MKRDEFLKLIKQFSEQPIVATEGRHVYLWHGDRRQLQATMPANAFVDVDLHKLAMQAERAPRAQDQVQRLLRRLIQSYLSEVVKDNHQQFVIITGCDLLSRYAMPLNVFYETVSDTVMVVFVVSPAETNFTPGIPLPDYISINPTAIFSYLKNRVGENAVIDTTEDRS
jgi:hypothetical protein